MTIEIEPQAGLEHPDEVRRRLLLSGLAGGAAIAMSKNAQAQEKVPGAGPIKAGRGSQLTGKVAVVTGAPFTCSGAAYSGVIGPPSTVSRVTSPSCPSPLCSSSALSDLRRLKRSCPRPAT